MRNCYNRALPPFALAAIVIVVCGCGKTGPARFDVMGTVTYHGQPLPRGVIRFEPDAAKGNRGPVGIATIRDGRYSTADQGARGTPQGPLTVWITGLPVANPSAEFQEPLFADYRAEIELVPGGHGPTRFDFDVPRNAGRK